MKVKDVVEFRTSLPDGAVEDEHDFLVWPGRPAAEAIGETLRRLGCEVDEVEPVGEKGWDFNFRYRGRRLWSRVTQIEWHIAFFDDRNLWPRLIGGTHPLYRELLNLLATALAGDPRFQELRWVQLKQFEPTLSSQRQPVG